MEHKKNMEYYLKTATLFTNTPHSNVKESIDAPDKRRFRGKRGRRIVFSCTWNEKRKKDIEEASIAHGKIGSVGVATTPLFPLRVLSLVLLLVVVILWLVLLVLTLEIEPLSELFEDKRRAGTEGESNDSMTFQPAQTRLVAEGKKPSKVSAAEIFTSIG